jgi:hypothetical protein
MEEPMTEKEINEQFTAKIQRGIFKPVARHLTNLSSAEDRLQDAIAQTWWMYRRYATEKNTILPDAILVFSCRQRAVDLNRNFVPADGRRSQDVLDPRAYRDRKVEVLRLDGVADEQCSDGDRDIQSFHAEYMAANPSRKIRSAIDLERWVGQLSGLDRFVMEQKYIGSSMAEIAAELGMPYGQVYYHARQKGLELATRAGVRIGGRRVRHKSQDDIDAAMRQADDVAAHGEA